MLVLDVICHETIWGGHKIAQMTGFGKGKKLGHLYSVYCREGISNKIINGQNAGKCLNDVFPLWRSEFGMEEYPHFPLTLALTEAGDNLSIQVHPDDSIAQKLEAERRGKRESWYFIDPPESGSIFNGCTCANDTEKDALIEEGRYLDMAALLPTEAGDYIFVEPGTLHSISKGSLVYEIEEGADSTYRFYDFERLDSEGSLRELHIEKARAALDIHKQSVARKYPQCGEIIEETYSTAKLENIAGYRNKRDTLECLTLVAGSAQCDGANVMPGMTVLLWPGETIENCKIELAFVSYLRKGV